MADNIAALGFDISSQPLKDATVNMAAAEAAAKKLGISTDEMVKKIQSASNVTKATTTATGQHAAATATSAKEMERASAAATKLARESAMVGRVLGVIAGEAQSLAGGLGRIAPLITSLGVAGIATAATLGALAIVMKKVADAALEMGDKAGELKDLSETVGFTTSQLQALKLAALDVGVSQQGLGTGIERFSAALSEIKDRSGSAYEALLAINPVIAQQVSNAKTLADAWDLVFKALNKADTEQRNQAARAIFGRGGIGLTRVGGATFDAGGVQKYTDALRQADLLTQKQIEHFDDLRDSIAKNMLLAEQIIVSQFTGPVLESLKDLSKNFLDLARAMQGVDWASAAAGASLVGGAISKAIFPLTALISAWRLYKDLTAKPEAGPGQGPSRFDQVFGDLSQVDAAAAGMKKIMQAADDARQAIIQTAADSKRLMDALGGTATPAERLKDQIKQLNAQVAQGKIFAPEAAMAIGRLNREFAANRIQETVAALGNAATAEEQYGAKVAAVKEKVAAQGLSQETLNRALKGLEVDEAIAKLEREIAALGEAATEAEKYALALMKLDQQQKAGKISADAVARATLQLNPIFKQLSQAVQQIGSDMAAAFIDGKNAADALHDSLNSVAKTAASATITNLLKQDFAGAAISAGVGIVSWIGSKIFGGGNEAEKQKQAQAQADAAAAAAQRAQAAADRRSAFRLQGDLGGVDTSTLTGALRAFEFKASDERAKEIAAGGEAITELERSLAAERLKIVEDFAEQVRQREQSNQDRLFAATNDANTLAGQLAAFDRVAEQERAEEVKAGGEAIVLEQAQAAERLAIQKAYNDAVIARDKALGDRLFGAVTDTSTLQGRLALFDREAQAQREEEIKLGGENLVNLEETLMAERLRVIQDFSKQSVAAEKARSEQILSFINNLLIGASSPLSPSARLATAQSTFNQQLALAQGGDPTALGRITSDANQLIEAAKGFFGSSTGFQTIFNQVVGALQGLATAPDPVVAALEEISFNQTVQTGVLNIIDASTAANTALQITANALQDTANTLMDVTNNLLFEIRELNDTATAQLDLLNTQFDNIPASTGGPFGTITSNNKMIEALNKIVLNTALIVGNTYVTAVSVAASTPHGALGTGGVYATGALAAGGWVNGGMAGYDSVPILAMPGEFVVRKSVAQANAGLLTSMNSGGGDVASLLRAIANKIDQNTQATLGQTSQLNRETKFAARKRGAA